MKKIGEYTAKGQIPINTTRRIELFDGRFDTGYRIVSFTVTPANAAGNYDAYGKLSTDGSTQGQGNEWNWDFNEELAWAFYGTAQSAGTDSFGSWVDPDNMVVEDIFFRSGTGTDGQAVNYMIHLEKYDITDWQGALAMVRNRSQA